MAPCLPIPNPRALPESLGSGLQSPTFLNVDDRVRLLDAACCCLLAFVFIDPTTDSALENSTTSESPFATVILEEPEVFDNIDFYYWLDVYDTEVIASSD